MNLRYEQLKLKEDIEYYLDAIRKNDLIVFDYFHSLKVIKHNKGSNIVVLEDKKEYDLYKIYDSLLTIMSVYDNHGHYSKSSIFIIVRAVVQYIYEETKYHPYPEAVTAVLNGNKDHYIAEFTKNIAGFGMLPDITLDDVSRCLMGLEIGGFVKQKFSDKGYPYYYTRKDKRIWKRKFVFYVCYGSNMCEDRFKCYLTGKPNKRLGIKAGKKCKDQSPIVGKTSFRIPYEMYFGNSSSTWDGGGVCFLNPKRISDTKKFTFATAYLISEEQYEHVRKCEGKSPEWYGKEIELDPMSGIPAKTFTSEKVHKFNMPSKRYLDVVRAGLIEWGLTYKQAVQYLYCKTNKK